MSQSKHELVFTLSLQLSHDGREMAGGWELADEPSGGGEIRDFLLGTIIIHVRILPSSWRKASTGELGHAYKWWKYIFYVSVNTYRNTSLIVT